jgi:hypothetical protein
MRLTVRIAAVALAIGVVAPDLAARQKSPQNANYRLAATLDPATHTIAGRGRLTWRNIASTPATELRFHMYWNAWRDTSSTWFRELRNPMANRAREDPGSIDLTGLSLVSARGSQDLLPRVRYIAPDDGNALDRTVLSVALDAPVSPGGVIDIDMAWTSHVPRTFARTGALGRYFFIGQWFPKIAVFEDAGWNSHQFHATTEFFADYGVYDVSLTVPSGWIVGATGREQSRTDNRDGTTTHRYVQADVHDFAWTTSPDFLEAGRRLDVPRTSGVDVRLLLQPEHWNQADRHFEAAARALSKFSEWFGPYPYGQLTIIDPVTIVNSRAQGDDTGGMEYPTLITAGTRWSMPWRYSEPEDVVTHEIGHQFWQGVVGNNEFEQAWMDEGLTTYVTGRLMGEAYAGRFVTVERYFGGLVPWTYRDVSWSRDVQGNRILGYRRAPDWDALSTPSWRHWPPAGGAITYAKTALWLTSLERMFGWEMVQKTLAAFYTRGTFRHPNPNELFAIASSAAGRDLTWFFDAVHRSAATFDYAVADVFDFSPGRDDNDEVESTVVVRRVREGVFPVEVRTTFDDGWSASERWDGRDSWREFKYRRKARVRTVEIDPTRILTLDVNYTNNSWTAEPRAAEVSRRWALRWMTWLQTVLVTYAFFA